MLLIALKVERLRSSQPLTRDNTYRWVRPLKAWEYYVDQGLDGVDYVEGLNWLREHVLAGRIRVEFDGIEITPTIARLFLECRDLKWPDESAEHPLPPDFILNRPDIQRLLKQRNSPPAKKPGRPKSAGSFAAADRALVTRMNQMVSTFGVVGPEPPPWPRVPSPTAAAKILVAEGAAEGGGTDESKVRRLVKRYQEIFGDDG